MTLIGRCTLLLMLAVLGTGCSTLRTTDPPRTATEQFLQNEATRRSIEQLSAAPLRDRIVYVDTSYVVRKDYPETEYLFLVSELRARLLEAGARLTMDQAKAQVIVEVRVIGVGIDRLDTLIGLPAVALNSASNASTSVPVLTPELAIVKRLRQHGYSSVAYVAYWKEGGELLSRSGPFLGKTEREDFWILGFGPRTVGDIAPAKD
jgi:hypothetical protein